MKQFAEAVEKAKIDVVPKMVVGTNGTGGLLDSLLAMTLGDKLMGGEGEVRAPRSAEAEALRGDLLRSLAAGTTATTATTPDSASNRCAPAKIG